MANNIIIKNIYYMLSYAYQTLKETGYDHIAEEDFENIHDFFAAILVQGVGNQIKRGLHRDYIPKEEALNGIRGQIRISESIKTLTMTKSKLVCAYDEFTENSYHNQVLKSVMFLLLKHGKVKSENKKALRKLLLYFSSVDDIQPQAIRWNALKYNRNNASYRMILNICRFVVKGLLLTTESGSHKLATWLQDEEMHRLYEKFVLSYFQKHHPEYSPRAAYIDWNIEGEFDTKALPYMKTDITLTQGIKRLIIDTKYYGHTMQINAMFDKATFISGNLYQIFTYVKNSDKEATGNVAGVLLYAKTDEALTPNNDFVIGGNKISLKTLDLNQDWSNITTQLEKLCEWLEAA